MLVLGDHVAELGLNLFGPFHLVLHVGLYFLLVLSLDVVFSLLVFVLEFENLLLESF